MLTKATRERAIRNERRYRELEAGMTTAEEIGRHSMVSHILNPIVPAGGLDDPQYREAFRRCNDALRLAAEARAATVPPHVLAELKRLYAKHGYQSTADVIAQVEASSPVSEASSREEFLTKRLAERGEELERLRGTLREIKDMTPGHYAREHRIIDDALATQTSGKL